MSQQNSTEKKQYSELVLRSLSLLWQVWTQHQALLLASLQGKVTDLCGDGRCDSPGFSAKFLTYSFLSQSLGKIIHTEQVQVREVSRNQRTLQDAHNKRKGKEWLVPLLEQSGQLYENALLAETFFFLTFEPVCDYCWVYQVLFLLLRNKPFQVL